MDGLIRFFYRQHLFGNLLTVIVILAGLYSVFTIRKDLFPQVEFDITLVSAVFPGASPDQVEKLIVTPLEQAIKEVDGIKKVQSQAVDSRAVITITMDPDARDPDEANDDIQRAVDQVDDYPADAERPVVTAIETGQSPVIELAITSKTLDEITLRDTAKYVADQLSNVKGVAKVIKDGWRRKEIRIQADQEKLTRNTISLTSIIDSIKAQNMQLPAGDLILKDGAEVAVKTDGELRSPEDVENVSLRRNFEGFGIKVKDVATVDLALEKANLLYRTNGVQSFKLTIVKKSKADALKTVEEVRETMDKISLNLPKGTEYFFINDFTFYLKNRLATLSTNMLVGIVLVCLILALFFPWRVALVVALGLPFALLSGITIIQYYGLSLNLISLIGLIIVSGMLVDDIVVVSENIFRRLEGGEDTESAILQGTIEMFPAVTASVLTTVAAFGPMLFMSGIFGKFVFEIPLLVIVPLMISLFEAFLIAPGHFLTIVGHRARDAAKKVRENQETKHWYDRLIVPRYRSMIEWTVDNRYKMLGAFFGLLLVTVGMVTQMRFVLFPPDGIYAFFIRVDGKPGMTIEQMSKLVGEVEPFIAKLSPEELVDYTSYIGIQQNDPNDPLTKRAAHYAQIRVNLTPEQARSRNVNEIVEDLRKNTPKPEGATKLNFEIAKGGPPQGRPISINIAGDDFEVLRKIANDVKAKLATIEGVQDIEDSEVIGKKEIRVIPDSQAATQLGLTVRDVANSVRASFAGIVASSTRTLDEEIDIRVQLKPPKTEAQQQINNIMISTRENFLIPVSRMAKLEESDSRLIVQHEKYKRILNVSAQVNLEVSTAAKATAEAQELLKDVLKDHPQYELVYGGENEDTAESMASLGRAFLVAAALIFMILVLTFKSFVQPVMVLLAIPLGFMGVVFALLLHGKPFSFMSMLGIIALAGVIVNNSIVYIDFYNSLRAEGKNLRQALIDAATTRLRPIVLTSLTTVLGLMPTAYGIGGVDGFVAVLALALGWGLMLGSILTVIFFPAILRVVEDLRGQS